MDFEERARKAHRRGQLVRAAVLLAEGLKRHPERVDALDFLTNLFANELASPGLEQDLVDAMAQQDDLRERIDFILERYAERDKPTMGRELARAANERFGGFDWPPPATVEDVGQSDLEPVEDAADTQVSDEGKPAADEPPLPSEAQQELTREAQHESTPYGGESDEDEQLFQEGLRAAQVRLSADEVGTASASDQEAVDDISSAPTMEQPRTDAPAAKADEDASDGAAKAAAGRKLLLVVLIAVLAGGAAFLGWTHLNDDGETQDTDVEQRELDSLDTAKRDAVPESLGVAQETVSSDARKQAEFIEAVYAVDWGERLAGALDGADRFAVGYQAVLHAQNGDFERGIARVTVLEQRFPGSLIAVWARGMLAEYRGRYDRALDAYRAGARKFELFVPFYTGQIRILARQGRLSRDGSVFDELAAVSPEHPYLTIKGAVWPNPELIFDGEQPTTESDSAFDGGENDAARPRIVRAIAQLHAGVLAGDLASKRDMLSSAVQQEPALAPAQLYLGTLKAEALEIEAAESAFASAMEVEGVPDEFAWLVQATAQQALLAAGRPDRGLVFAVPIELEGADAEESLAERVPESLVDPIAAGAEFGDAVAIRALGLRAMLYAELGLLSTAETSLERARAAAGNATETEMLDFVEVELRIIEGKRNEAIRVRRQMKKGPYRQLALAAVSYHDGDYQVAVQAGEKAFEARPVRQWAARYMALSLAASGKVRQALAHLDRWDVGGVLGIDFRAVEMRVLSRVDPESSDVADTYDAFEAAEPTGVHRRIDLAGTDFWRKRYDRALGHLESARDAAPKHPEVNWLSSLVARSSESSGDVRAYLSDSWRGQSGDASVLLELGQIQLELERYSQARRLFYRALLADRTSIEAIRGMGRAYLGYDRARGRRDMAGFIENYGSDSRSLAPKAEVFRWLAVLHGVRKGEEKGYGHLEQAVELVGETPPLLVERARYHEAKGDTAAARRAFARALERNSSFASAHLGLARTALDTGDEAVARTHLTRFLALRGSGEGTDWARAKLEQLRDTPNDSDAE
jgi:tetratricopeptide (TPR) repeat protein